MFLLKIKQMVVWGWSLGHITEGNSRSIQFFLTVPVVNVLVQMLRVCYMHNVKFYPTISKISNKKLPIIFFFLILNFLNFHTLHLQTGQWLGWGSVYVYKLHFIKWFHISLDNNKTTSINISSSKSTKCAVLIKDRRLFIR